MNSLQAKQILEEVNFGEVDGYGDPCLDKYFLDNDYWEKIVEKKTYFVLGRKGTGKSAMYRIIRDQGAQKGHIVENTDFGEFPFQKLLSLSDDDFAAPNQYQSIWKNLILNLLARMICRNNAEEEDNEILINIRNYINKCIGDNIVDLHKENMQMIQRTNVGLQLTHTALGREVESVDNFNFASYDVTKINSYLLKAIEEYLISCTHEVKFIIQFDRLDDNYNQYHTESYFQSIISLFKVVYEINQKFRQKNISNAKIILYLRSDIYVQLGKRDAESSRWDDFRYDINWAVVHRSDWKNPLLLQMINKRIAASFPKTAAPHHFREIFNNSFINYRAGYYGEDVKDIFKYVVDHTMHRPRDLVKFCLCVQREVSNDKELSFNTIKHAFRTYSSWLVYSELSNEINPITGEVETIFDLLRLLGSRPFSISDFNIRYKSIGKIELDCEKLMYYLYDLGILYNTNTENGFTEIRSVFRNVGSLSRNMKLCIHPAVWEGIKT